MPIDQRLKDAISAYLNRHRTVQAMVRASTQGRPAVSAIGRDLLDQFGAEVVPDPIKQWIGKTVKTVMEVHGHELVEKDQPARSPLFTKGAVYRRV